MKISISTAIVLFVSVLFFSCKKEQKTAEEPTQMEQVMAIHDEVMPKMGTLAKYTAQLKAKVDTTAMGKKYELAMKDLQEANMAMMDWMKGFGDRFDSEEILNGKALDTQKQAWLNEEEDKVKALKKQIYSSIERAEELLKEN